MEKDKKPGIRKSSVGSDGGVDMVMGPKQKSFKDQNETLGQNMLGKK